MPFLSLTLILNGAHANQKPDKFTACKLYVLASNCNIGRDKKAPAFMKEGGPATCFVGLDVAPEDDPKLRAPFKQIIQEEKYTRQGLEKEIIDIKKCLVSHETLSECKIGFIAAGGMQQIEFCK